MMRVAITLFALWAAFSMASPTGAEPGPLGADAVLRHMTETTPCLFEQTSTLSHFAEYALCIDEFRNGSGDVEFINALDESQLLTFPYCSALSPEQCRAVLVLLEELLESSDDPDNAVVNDTGVTTGTRDVTAGIRDVMTGTRGVTTGTRWKRALKDDADKRQMAMLLRKYRKWRKKHGYGRAVGRWGRDLSRVSGEARTAENETGASGERRRQRRAIFSRDSRISVQELLHAYKSWRAKNGYGKAIGRWGR
ncbi:hypothetical protein LSAT2_028191 [Lamellibrachia satsuma]|nr:hypothetical protein LSAT2_028191 [Lamellibrachia satsuma]